MQYTVDCLRRLIEECEDEIADYQALNKRAVENLSTDELTHEEHKKWTAYNNEMIELEISRINELKQVIKQLGGVV